LDEHFIKAVLFMTATPPLIIIAPPPPVELQSSNVMPAIQDVEAIKANAPPLSSAEQFLKTAPDKYICPPVDERAPPLPFVNRPSKLELRIVTVPDPDVRIAPPFEMAAQFLKVE
jgi:hypothetical protein